MFLVRRLLCFVVWTPHPCEKLEPMNRLAIFCQPVVCQKKYKSASINYTENHQLGTSSCANFRAISNTNQPLKVKRCAKNTLIYA